MILIVFTPTFNETVAAQVALVAVPVIVARPMP